MFTRPATGVCPESDECSSHRHSSLFNIHFNIILASVPMSSMSAQPLCCSD